MARPSPESVVTLLAVYDSHAEAAQSVSAVIAAGILPATLEMMDSTIIQAVEDSKPCGYPRDAAAVLIIEVDGPGLPLHLVVVSVAYRKGARIKVTAVDVETEVHQIDGQSIDGPPVLVGSISVPEPDITPIFIHSSFNCLKLLLKYQLSSQSDFIKELATIYNLRRYTSEIA